MGNYVNRNSLYLGESRKEIKRNMNDILIYIYYQISLDHDEMKKIYENVKVPVNFDDDDDNRIYKDYYRYSLRFVNHYKRDKKYIYQINAELDIKKYKNKKLINEIHHFFIKKSPEELYLNNIKYIELLNHCGINDNLGGIKCVDWKLHFWSEYQITSDVVCLSFHDLVIAAYKIKSHKFDNKYEAYHKIQKMIINDNSLKIIIKFEHNQFGNCVAESC